MSFILIVSPFDKYLSFSKEMTGEGVCSSIVSARGLIPGNAKWNKGKDQTVGIGGQRE